MPVIRKNTLLKYIPDIFITESTINPLRIHHYNHNQIQKGYIIYLCERELRIKDNFALQFGLQKSKELKLPIKVIHPKIKFEYKPKQQFIDEQILLVKNNFADSGINFEIIEEEHISEYLKQEQVSFLIIDFNPVRKQKFLKNLPFKIFEIDGHNIVPARFVSNKKEYGARTIRPKIYRNISDFITEYVNITNTITTGETEFNEFIENKLPMYAEFKNNPVKNVVSELSKYLTFGFISAQRVAIEIIKSNADNENKEAFLEELIIRKELSDNFCLYCNNYETFTDIAPWAKNSLNIHKNDLREYNYSLEEFEQSKTDEKLWNASQNQLVRTGTIHGYLRMYWAKKILEWSATPEYAHKIAVYLNNKYSYDSPSPNGYTGILWAIGGLHDRAFKDWKITGKIRRMSYESIKQKFNIYEYINKFK